MGSRACVAVERRAWFFGKQVLLAPAWIERISYVGWQVFINLSRAAIKEAPRSDADAPVDSAFEKELHEHYCGFADSAAVGHNAG